MVGDRSMKKVEPNTQTPSRVGRAAEIELGEGLVIALADVYALSNKGLGEEDHAIWLMNLVARLTRGDPQARLAFDEFHAGFPYRDRPWIAMAKLLWDDRWAWSVTQVSVVAGLALLAAGAHFGKPRGVVQGKRRTQGEFTRAAGRLLHAARAGNLAFSILFAHYRDRLCRAMRLPADASDVALAGALETRGATEAAGTVRAGAAQRTRVRPSDAEILDITQKLHKAVEMIEHGVGPTHSTRGDHSGTAR